MERRTQNSDEFFLSPLEAKTAIIEYLRSKLAASGIAYDFPTLDRKKTKSKSSYKFKRIKGDRWTGRNEQYTTVSHVDSGVLVKVHKIAYQNDEEIEIDDEDELELDDLEE